MEELIDVLDENGILKDVKQRSEVHNKGLWHRSVHVWIINSDGNILLQKRSEQKKFFPNVWDCAYAGHISHGETAITTAIREGEEELGLKIVGSNLKHLFTNKESISYCGIINNEFVDIFIYECDINLKSLTLQKEEVAKAKWVTEEEFLKMLKTDKVLHHDEKEYEILYKYLENKFVLR